MFRPRTAFERLNALEVAELEDSATMARWALMYSEAMVANNLAAPADTIVDIAVDYYGSHSDYERLRGCLITDVIKQPLNVIDDLCETYYATQGTKAERKSIVDRVRSQIDALKVDEGLFSEMESAVNECLGDMLALFTEELPNLKRDDYRMMVYLACNLSNRIAALLIGESVDVVYKRKSRLKARISTSGCPHSGLFLSVF